MQNQWGRLHAKVMLIIDFCDSLGVKKYWRYRRCAKETIVIAWCLSSHNCPFSSLFLHFCLISPQNYQKTHSWFFFLLLLELWGFFCVCLARHNIVTPWMLTRWVALNKHRLVVICKCSKMWASTKNKQLKKKRKKYNPWCF